MKGIDDPVFQNSKNVLCQTGAWATLGISLGSSKKTDCKTECIIWRLWENVGEKSAIVPLSLYSATILMWFSVYFALTATIT